MRKNEYNVVGVMSGTSLDGIDVIYATFNFNKTWTFEIIYAETVEYPIFWYEKLKGLVSCDLEEIEQIDIDYTEYLGGVIKAFIEKNHIINLDAVCSHGHTALHQPENGLTYQIGNLPKIAQILEQTIVCDFRVQDVKLEGQGAPLVPIGDELLFSGFGACLNLGGFANISMNLNKERLAYDICPVNIVLNHYASKLGLKYDHGGQLAKAGVCSSDLLNELNKLEFYGQKPPKSLGLEWVQKNIFPIIDSYDLDIKDILRTFVEHISLQLAKSIAEVPKNKVLVTGGGAYNAFLMSRLNEMSDNEIIIPKASLIEYKEALIFGFLGVLKLRGEVNCLKSVTGAKKNHSSGIIFLP